MLKINTRNAELLRRMIMESNSNEFFFDEYTFEFILDSLANDDENFARLMIDSVSSTNDTNLHNLGNSLVRSHQQDFTKDFQLSKASTVNLELVRLFLSLLIIDDESVNEEADNN